MLNIIECWIAEQLSPLAQDKELDEAAAAWLRTHAQACPRHRIKHCAVLSFAPDSDRVQEALARIRSSWPKAGREPAQATSAWAAELWADWRSAPVPMAALSVLSVLMAIGQYRLLLR